MEAKKPTFKVGDMIVLTRYYEETRNKLLTCTSIDILNRTGEYLYNFQYTYNSSYLLYDKEFEENKVEYEKPNALRVLYGNKK